MVYGGRRQRSMAFVEELRSIVPQEMLVLVPQDQYGLMDLEREVTGLPEGWVICACGPAAMLKALEDLCDRHGARDRLVVERFTISQELEALLSEADNRPVTVHLLRSGITIEVPAAQSILAAVKDVAPVISSCTEGYCGTCETTVLKGIPEHRDSVLTDEERESNHIMMICVSRARSDELTLDL
jgi:ferredoxin